MKNNINHRINLQYKFTNIYYRLQLTGIHVYKQVPKNNRSHDCAYKVHLVRLLNERYLPEQCRRRQIITVIHAQEEGFHYDRGQQELPRGITAVMRRSMKNAFLGDVHAYTVSIDSNEETRIFAYHTPPIQITRAYMLFSQAASITWKVHPKEHGVEVHSMYYPLPPDATYEVPGRCYFRLESKSRSPTNELIEVGVEFRSVVAYSSVRAHIIQEATVLPNSVAQLCESYMWCEDCWDGTERGPCGKTKSGRVHLPAWMHVGGLEAYSTHCPYMSHY